MLLVTGCGPIGSRLAKSFADTDKVTWLCDKERPTGDCLKYDIKKESDIKRIVEDLKPSRMVLTEEIPDVSFCESHRMYAMEYNTRGTRYFVEAGNALGTRVTYISTALVFDGRKTGGLYTEKDVVNPINVYGETKLMGEVAADKSQDRLVFRLGELYGKDVDGFVKRVYNSLKAGTKIELARDMYFSPIFIDDAVDAIVKLTSESIGGVYNLAGPERISQYEMGLKIASAFGFNEELLVPLSADALGSAVRMPRDTSLDVSLISAIVKIRGIDDGLRALKESL